MSMLTYTVLTDPASLEASAAGRPSMGTVYLLVTNTGQQAAYWSTITVSMPVGNGDGHLTSNFNKIKPKVRYVPKPGTSPSTPPSVNVQRQGSNAFQVTASAGTGRFALGDYMVLTLNDVTVARTAGLAVLTVTETTGRTNPKPGKSLPPSDTMVAVVKTASKELSPHSFRPDKAMVDVDAGEKPVLRWEGPAGFGYQIMYPGAPQPVPVSGSSWSPPAPKRATTYILIATDPATQQQHFLTTTVQVRNPELETLTATTEIKTPRVQGIASNWGLTITGTGAEISDTSGVKGTLTAGDAILSGVATQYVKGLNAGEGDITFLQGGVKVWSALGSSERGTLEASGLYTGYVQGFNSGEGVIGFYPGGVKIWHEGGSGVRGTLEASGIRADYVSGPNDGDGDIRFLQGGMKLWSALGSNDPGTLHVSGIRADYVSGPNDGDGDIRFLQGGMKLWSALGSNDLGTLYARKVNGGVASGRSTPRYGWRQTGGNAFAITVDTSAAGFTSSPLYLIAIEGTDGLGYDISTSVIFYPSATGFTVYLRWRDNQPLTVADAERMGWHLNWVGYETS
ncbi:hypothetical protein GCM10018953_48040 [Streptosporangium nondiastaticum]|uniref:hypothetical protein n=1 Tax=Streptosporangium nondiastaticum TaxID=35764 RepID=UPI0031F97C2A